MEVELKFEMRKKCSLLEKLYVIVILKHMISVIYQRYVDPAGHPMVGEACVLLQPFWRLLRLGRGGGGRGLAH